MSEASAAAPRRVYGNVISPYARKVYLVLDWKGLDYESIDVLPHAQTDPFTRISRLGKIPGYTDDQIELSDSSVICDYLESRYPEPPIYPARPRDRAHALWIEEYADTHLQDLVLRGVVLERLIKPTVRGEPTDQARVDRILTDLLPRELDYLEELLSERSPDSPFLVGKKLSIADLAVTTCFINARDADLEPNAETHPRLADFVQTMLALPLFEARARVEADYMASLSRSA